MRDMTSDLILVIGIVLAALSVPAVLSALSDGRPPRAGAISILVAGGLIVWAVQSRPGGYRWEDIPRAFVRVVAHYMP
ncbi:MAG: hypothetical protein Kow0058_15290 [Roseovarius sp.]